MPEAAKTGTSRAGKNLLQANGQKQRVAIAGLTLTLSLASVPPAFAQANLIDRAIAFSQALTRQEITSLALTLGILLFAVVTAIALLRSRTRAAIERAEAKKEIARLRAEADRMTALLLSEPQVVVIWRNLTSEPVVLGEVAPISGLESSRRILAFGA